MFCKYDLLIERYEMKKKMEDKMKTKSLAIIILSTCLVACGSKGDNNKNISNTESKDTESISKIEIENEDDTQVDTEITSDTTLESDLAPEELEEYSKYLSGMDTYGFLLSEYDDVRAVDLGEVFYKGAGLSENLSEEEKEEYLQEVLRNDGNVYGLDERFIASENIDNLLKEKTGYSLQDFKDSGNDLPMLYLEKYGMYFSECGDTNYREFICTCGIDNGDGTITIYCESGNKKCKVMLNKETRQFISNEIIK